MPKDMAPTHAKFDYWPPLKTTWAHQYQDASKECIYGPQAFKPKQRPQLW
jgi:hypothetical protein